jgi:hypothetical protein
MHRKKTLPILSLIILLLLFLSSACSTFAPPVPTSTSTLQPTATNTVAPTKTAVPTSTPRPTITPNLAATQHMGELQAESQTYFDRGYINSADGKFMEYDDFKEEWAQLGWYRTWYLNQSARNFYLSAHFKWTSAYRSADISGCGFAFAIQEDGEKYSVFLDRSKVYFVVTNEYYKPFSPTRGTGRVNFENPFDQPVEADFTLIVNDAYAYVLVDDELIGEYTLSQSKNLRGGLGLTLLSGTNKDFGTRCEMTDIRVWTPWGG